ncbi:MAG: sensor histidine kinase [Deltaproteobacteria bacterium]|nr:sensor histidine kinase [Deltaproteobacteria bacterium]
MRATPLLIVVGVVSTVVLSAVGILILVFSRSGFDIASGVLVLIFSTFMLVGLLVGMVLLRRSLQVRALQTDFVSKVSHELRTPLASIRLFVDMLADGRTDLEKQRACLEALSAETSRLTRLIERLLSWARMESRHRTWDLRPERVDTLVAEALALVDPQVRESGVRVRFELPEDVPAVRADRVALVDALLNLMRNAVKYGGSGGVLILRVRPEGRRKVAIDVADHGPGIPPSERRRVFERFYRGSAARSARGIEGHGLGLAMARLVVRAHGGRLHLASREGEGACFTVVLPTLPAETALEVPSG